MKRNCLRIILLLSVGMLAGCTNKQNNATDNQNTAKENTAEATAAPKFEVPNVVGSTEKKAKEQLDKIGIKYEIIDDYSVKYKKGIICDQSIIGATDNNTITLTRSKGLSYYIDSLNGKKYKDVKKQLKLFKIDVDYTYSPDYGKGKVVTSSFAGTEMHKGESGTLTLSNGKYNEKKVVGVDVNKAKKQFPGAKFKIKYKRSSAKKNKVLSFDVGTSKNKRKIPVTLTLSNAKIVNVPNVVGKSEDKAIRIMKKRGIKYDIIYRYGNITSDPTKATGVVEEQAGHGKRSRDEVVILAVEKPAITISGITLSVDEFDDMNASIEFVNETKKQISSVELTVSLYDRVGEKTGHNNVRYVGPLDPGSWDTQTITLGTMDAAIEPVTATVRFMTGETQIITFKGRFWSTSDYAGGSMLRD